MSFDMFSQKWEANNPNLNTLHASIPYVPVDFKSSYDAKYSSSQF